MQRNSLKNNLYTLQDLYIMIRLSIIESAPFPADLLDTKAVLNVYLKEHIGAKLQVDLIDGKPSFSGEIYRVYQDYPGDLPSSGSVVGAAVRLFRNEGNILTQLLADLSHMREFMKVTGYLIHENGAYYPSDKLLNNYSLNIATRHNRQPSTTDDE